MNAYVRTLWAIAIYMVATNLKGVSSMKLHRDLKIRQPSAWHLAQRIRKGFEDGRMKMNGPVEVRSDDSLGRESSSRDVLPHETVSYAMAKPTQTASSPSGPC